MTDPKPLGYHDDGTPILPVARGALMDACAGCGYPLTPGPMGTRLRCCGRGVWHDAPPTAADLKVATPLGAAPQVLRIEGRVPMWLYRHPLDRHLVAPPIHD